MEIKEKRSKRGRGKEKGDKRRSSRGEQRALDEKEKESGRRGGGDVVIGKHFHDGLSSSNTITATPSDN